MFQKPVLQVLQLSSFYDGFGRWIRRARCSLIFDLKAGLPKPRSFQTVRFDWDLMDLKIIKIQLTSQSDTHSVYQFLFNPAPTPMGKNVVLCCSLSLAGWMELNSIQMVRMMLISWIECVFLGQCSEYVFLGQCSEYGCVEDLFGFIVELDFFFPMGLCMVVLVWYDILVV